jgi:hypothetical protein
MWQQLAERVAIEVDLVRARRRAQAYTPFSPAWDAAMNRVEDLERELWSFDHAEVPSGRL